MFLFFLFFFISFLYFFFFFFNDTATTEIYTLSLHDALPICGRRDWRRISKAPSLPWRAPCRPGAGRRRLRSEEHTSELQSHVNLVCRLLLEKQHPPHSRPHRFIQQKGPSVQ